jgi:hypothetical protein
MAQNPCITGNQVPKSWASSQPTLRLWITFSRKAGDRNMSFSYQFINITKTLQGKSGLQNWPLWLSFLPEFLVIRLSLLCSTKELLKLKQGCDRATTAINKSTRK